MTLTISDIANVMETWAPAWTAWERDNVGLQLGDPSRSARTIGVTLDVTNDVVTEAIRRRADMVISHHPLFFKHPRSITTQDRIGSLAMRLIEHGIAVFASHTNLDSVQGGVNMTLAKALDLKDVRFLAPLEGRIVKFAVFVPPGHVDRVQRALTEQGAGIIGSYSSCTFNTPGIGTFRPEASARPFTGGIGRLETTEEIKVETVVPRSALHRVLSAVRAVHPYDEMAYDVYPVDNPDPTYGMGAIGTLSRPVALSTFLRAVKRSTGARHLLVSGSARRIRTVAVCGGSGSEYIGMARDAGADVFVTADVKYHAHQESTQAFAIVDAGHWETEHLVLPVIARRLRSALKRQRASGTIYVTRVNTNPLYTI